MVILEHLEVAEVSVIGVRDREWGEAVKAVCVLKPGSSLTPQRLIDFVASRIARFKKPKYVDFVPALPKASDRSIDREKVKTEYGKGNNDQGGWNDNYSASFPYFIHGSPAFASFFIC